MKRILNSALLRSGGAASLSLLMSLCASSSAHAQASSEPAPAATEAPSSSQPAAGAANGTQANQNPPAPTGFWERSNLLGDMGGLRTVLGNYGVTFGLQETSEYMNNLSGGTRRGGAYDGETQMGVGIDTQKAFGLPGGTFNVSAFQIHGSNLTEQNLQTLQFATGVEADSSTRLWELWYQQAFLGGKVDVKVGQQSLDQEFMVSQYAGTFINATFGWQVLPSTDLPGGGPAYPLSALGVRMRVQATDAITVLGGVFNGNPAPGAGDPQRLNSSGTNFNLSSGALIIGEVQYAINQPPASPSDPKPRGLPGTYKLGFWYNTTHFADQGVDNTGLSLANPRSTGIPASHSGDYSIYAGADQMVWRPSPDSPQSVGVFARIMGAPGDRNLVDLGVNAGVTLKAPFKGRDNDVVGLAFGYAKIGSHAQDLASNQAIYTPGYPSRSAETLLEATYQFQVTPWWQLQADFQYIWAPSGGIPNPDGGGRIGNEAVVGARTVVTF